MAKKSEKIEEEKTTSETEKKEEKKKVEKPKKLSQAEFEKKVIELADQDLTSEKIGETLRRQNIHPKDYDKKISKILGNKYINPDLKNVENKLEKINKHCEKNKQDKRAIREKSRIFSQLKKLKEYFKLN